MVSKKKSFGQYECNISSFSACVKYNFGILDPALGPRPICNKEKVFQEIEKLSDKKDVIHKLGHNDNTRKDNSSFLICVSGMKLTKDLISFQHFSAQDRFVCIKNGQA